MVPSSLILLIVLELLVKNTDSGGLEVWRSRASYTRLLELTNSNFERCHTCILQNLGFDRVHLVAKNKFTRVYRIKSYVTILEPFLTECNIVNRLCQLQTDLKKIPPCSSLLWKTPVLEYAFSLISMHMDITTLGISRDETLRIKFSNLETYGTIPFLFFDDIQIMQHWKYKRRKEQLEQDENDLVKMSHNQKPSREKYLNGPSSVPGDLPSLKRCFYAYPRQSQCERCLALHSISLEVRAYPFISLQGGFHFVFAFTSFYAHIKIQENCAKNYCGSIYPLSAIACYHLNHIFPRDEKILQYAGHSAKHVQNQIETVTPDHNGLKSSELDIFFLSVVSRRDFGSDSPASLDIDPRYVQTHPEIFNIEKFLQQPKISCLRIRSTQSNRLTSLRCLILRAGDRNLVVLVRHITLTEQIIFVEPAFIQAIFPNECERQYTGSRIIAPKNPLVFCDFYLTKYKIKPYRYPELSTLTTAEPEPCFLSNHPTDRKRLCCNCLKAISTSDKQRIRVNICSSF